ncbi:uncharacterized protein DNG_06499 [Cephalotrichum gorgonifer]|uniref:Zn(2)-C6 fungal-type domain-containing protein n=1 Tax=Cephalotrichum gorgonifer TaxID=2041049 RepID=A0AAE8MZS4_9PEZI|nr:uncharacterized protein DNG_06499 [Cephalotrichum gorgonifer]
MGRRLYLLSSPPHQGALDLQATPRTLTPETTPMREGDRPTIGIHTTVATVATRLRPTTTAEASPRRTTTTTDPTLPQDTRSSTGLGPLALTTPNTPTVVIQGTACRYCRKRKIRCSGYQNAPGGRCINCTRMNQECIFQPVSSSSTAAFVHVSAVPGGIAPGTPLYGAYGQPLPGGGGPPGQQAPPPGPPPLQGGPPQGAQYPPPHHIQNPAYYQPAMRSPTDLHSPYSESDAASASGRRRRRESEDGHERRLPPPNVNDEEAWRRSPVSSSNSPRSQYYPSQPPMPAPPGGVTSAHTPPVSSSGPTPPHRSPTMAQSSGPGSNGHHDGGQRSGSSTKGTTPTPQGAAPPPPTGPGSKSVMRVTSILGDAPAHDIDRNMLGRLSGGPK